MSVLTSAIDTLSAEVTVKIVYLICKWIYSWRKKFARSGSKLFPFRAKGFWCAGKQNRKTQKLPPLYKIAEQLPSVLSLFNSFGAKFQTTFIVCFFLF